MFLILMKYDKKTAPFVQAECCTKGASYIRLTYLNKWGGNLATFLRGGCHFIVYAMCTIYHYCSS